MKQLFEAIWKFSTGMIVFTICIAIGIVFNVVYPWYMAIKERSIKLFFKIIWRLIDGTLSTIADILMLLVTCWDIMANVWGEWIEDTATTEEKTQFGKKEITISASIGHLEKEKLPMFERTKKFSIILNIVFGEKRHALGSWLKYLAIKEVEALDLKGKQK